LLFGIENHPEKTPDEMLARIGDGGDGTIGTTVDTGWYGTHGYDAAEALRKLAGHVVHVHLKDVLKPGGHETCRYGRGCVPIADCVRVLKQTGYQGPIAVEHDPERFDPSEDCLASLAMLKGWLAS
jgi:sugar phosphate isomerase/epimerase